MTAPTTDRPPPATTLRRALAAADTELMNAAASGMRAATTLLGVAADNLANMSTGGYRPRRAELADAGPGAGVTIGTIRAPDSGAESPDGLSGVDVASELVSATIAQTMYSANAAMLRTQAETVGALFSRRA